MARIPGTRTYKHPVQHTHDHEAAVRRLSLGSYFPIVPLVGIQVFSDLAIWALSRPELDARVALFENDYTPDQDSVLANFTAASIAGLQPQPLGTPVRGGLNVQGRATWTWPTNNFVAVGPGLPLIVYGFFVYCTDPWTNAAALIWCQRFVNPFGFFVAGETLPVPLAASFGQC